MHENNLRLGLDIGTNSIGWCLLRLLDGQPTGIVDMGVRIFSDSRDPKSKTSLAAARRIARLSRRRRDRFLRRRQSLLYFLNIKKLLPENKEERDHIFSQNPYTLRAKALDEKLSPFELGRILFHLNQRRGFKSNRRNMSARKEETDFQKEIAGLEKKLVTSKSRTLGEFLWQRFQNGEPCRARAGQELYPTRKMYEEEFDKIVARQAPFHPLLSKEDWQCVHHILFHQRPLKSQYAGPCQINYKHEPRVLRALPSYQKFLIAQELVNLSIVPPDGPVRALTSSERVKLWEVLNDGKYKTRGFDAVRKWLGLPEGTIFNLESETRDKLAGNETANIMIKPEYFGATWNEFSDDKQDEIVRFMLEEEDELKIIGKASKEWNLSNERAETLAKLPTEKFPKGFGRFCAECCKNLSRMMFEEGLFYKQAYDQLRSGNDHISAELKDRLEYYGKCLPEAVWIKPKDGVACIEEERVGKIGNPTVHVGLNQLRVVINCILKRYGRPNQIVVELARDLKMSEEQKKKLGKINRENKKNRDEAKEKLRELKLDPFSEDNIEKYLLWKELNRDDCNDRKCPYSGRQISQNLLFSHEVNVEHILPFGRTLDDSLANKTVAFRGSNQFKGNKSPSEAFGHDPEPYCYSEILERAKLLPPNKIWRFEPEAMARYEEKEDGFLGRHLNDTAYLAKVSKKYLQSICKKVDATPGRLTAFLRKNLGLNNILTEGDYKTRDDHRHHAIDAFVVAMTDTKTLQRVSESWNWSTRRIQIPQPWPEYRAELAQIIHSIIVSHRPDHYATGRFFEETAYGEIDPAKNEGFNLVASKPIDQLTRGQVCAVRDKKLRAVLLEKISGIDDKKEMARILAIFGDKKIKRVRFMEEDKSARFISHPKANPRHRKKLIPDEVLCIRFWKVPDGTIQAVPTYLIDAYQKRKLRPHRNAKLIYSLYKGDLVKLIHRGSEKIVRICVLGAEQISFTEHNDGKNNSKRDTTRYSDTLIREKQIRKIYVDPLGKVKDVGFTYD